DRLGKMVMLGCHRFLARARRSPVRLAPPPSHDLLQPRQDRLRGERLGDMGAIAVAGWHLFSGKARYENKGNAAPHQNVTRRPACLARRRPRLGEACPAASPPSGSDFLGGPKRKVGMTMPSYDSLHGLLLRIERYPQIDPQPAVFEFDLCLSAEAMADFALDQGQAEAMPRRLADPRPAALNPVEYEALPATSFDRPGDFERSAGHG